MPIGGAYTIDSASCSGLTLQGLDATNYTVAYSGGAFSATGTSTMKATVTKSGSTATITAKVKGTPAGIHGERNRDLRRHEQAAAWSVNCKAGNVEALNSSAQGNVLLEWSDAPPTPRTR